MRNLCIIPARGGSKRIPRKNVKPFMGKPIIAYSIEAALASRLFDEVMVSTDDEEIAAVTRQYGASVPFMRSAETANDYATTFDVMEEVLNVYRKEGKCFDVVCCVYATAPFVTALKLQKACQLLVEGSYDSVYTVVSFSYPVQRSLKIEGGKMRLMYPEHLNTRSQDLESVYHDAGQFYFSKVKALEASKSFLGNNTGGFVCSELEVQDLDTETDWKLAEIKYRLLHEKDIL